MSIRRSPTQVGDLEESLAALSVLEENLKKTDQITQKMATLLTTVFDARLGKLEKNIKPMYNTTRNLTLISQSKWLCPWKHVDVDIDATIAAMDNMKKNFDIVPAEEQIINAGYVKISLRGNGVDALGRSRIFRSTWRVLDAYRIHSIRCPDRIFDRLIMSKLKWYTSHMEKADPFLD